MSVLSYQSLKKIIIGVAPMIICKEFDLLQSIQPASIDIPISGRCFRVSVSNLPGHERAVEDLLKRFTLYEFDIKEDGSLLEKGMTYIIPLSVELNLTEAFYASFSPKSTIGRNDVFVRVMTESGQKFDMTLPGYRGPLYLEVTPLSFHTKIYRGQALTQMRINYTSTKPLTSEELSILHSEFGLVRDLNGKIVSPVIANGSLYAHLDLRAIGNAVGYEALNNPEHIIHLGKKETDKKELFWRPLVPNDGTDDIVLQANSFSLMTTMERITIPPCVCAAMLEYSVNIGEFRAHFAGFFDNGFGGTEGTQGVLEVRPLVLPAIFYHGQPMCRFAFYRTDEVPEYLYGSANNYTGARPKLPKNIIGFDNW